MTYKVFYSINSTLLALTESVSKICKWCVLNYRVSTQQFHSGSTKYSLRQSNFFMSGLCDRARAMLRTELTSEKKQIFVSLRCENFYQF